MAVRLILPMPRENTLSHATEVLQTCDQDGGPVVLTVNQPRKGLERPSTAYRSCHKHVSELLYHKTNVLVHGELGRVRVPGSNRLEDVSVMGHDPLLGFPFNQDLFPMDFYGIADHLVNVADQVKEDGVVSSRSNFRMELHVDLGLNPALVEVPFHILQLPIELAQQSC